MNAVELAEAELSGTPDFVRDDFAMCQQLKVSCMSSPTGWRQVCHHGIYHMWYCVQASIKSGEDAAAALYAQYMARQLGEEASSAPCIGLADAFSTQAAQTLQLVFAGALAPDATSVRLSASALRCHPCRCPPPSNPSQPSYPCCACYCYS